MLFSASVFVAVCYCGGRPPRQVPYQTDRLLGAGSAVKTTVAQVAEEQGSGPSNSTFQTYSNDNKLQMSTTTDLISAYCMHVVRCNCHVVSCTHGNGYMGIKTILKKNRHGGTRLKSHNPSLWEVDGSQIQGYPQTGSLRPAQAI